MTNDVRGLLLIAPPRLHERGGSGTVGSTLLLQEDGGGEPFLQLRKAECAREGSGHEGDDDHCANHGDGANEAANVAAGIPGGMRVIKQKGLWVTKQKGLRVTKQRKGWEGMKMMLTRTCLRSLQW